MSIDDLRGIAAEAEPSPWVDETPCGTLAAIELDTWHVYRDMAALMSGHSHLDDAEYEQEMRDLSGLLCDLERRRAVAVECVYTQIGNRRGL